MIELPGYQLIRELGRGGMARVYLALHEGLHRQVAIKVLYPNLAADSEFSDRFLREARIVASLSHPDIITIFDVGVHEGLHYIAMEYLPGDRLDDKIKAGLSHSEVLAIMKRMCMGLKYAHNKGFIHRDIKPDNILFREDGSPVITDFGVARAERSETKMTEVGTIIGTPHYMSPEQAQGIAIKSNSDIYSLGIVFYEMLTGDVPYRADSTVAVMYKHVNDPIPQLAGELGIYQALLDKLLAKKPGDRYQDAGDIIRDIEAIEAGKAPTLATRIRPRKGASKGPAGDGTRLMSQRRKASKGLLTSRSVLMLGSLAFVFTAVASAYFFAYLPYHEQQLVEAENKRKQQQLAMQKRLDLERLRQKAMQQEKAERERLTAEKQRLALIMRDKTQQANETQQRISRFIDKAEAALQKNRLKDAYRSFQQILAIETNNKHAQKGIHRVAGKYLALAERKAAINKFKLADAYVRSAIKISPAHPKLATTQQKIYKLKNRQLAKKTKVQAQESEAKIEPQLEAEKSPEKTIRKQRTFGGF